MRKRGHTEEEILLVLREAEAGETVVRSAAVMESASRDLTYGRRSTQAWG